MHQVPKILFCHETLHVSGVSCAHHQELSAVHMAIGMFHAGYLAAAQESQVGTLHETYQLPHVQLITPDDGHRRRPKHVEFRHKIKFWILDASCWLFIRYEICRQVLGNIRTEFHVIGCKY
jgi:hypothetical protein